MARSKLSSATPDTPRASSSEAASKFLNLNLKLAFVVHDFASARPSYPLVCNANRAGHRSSDINEIAKLKATINDLKDALRNKRIAIVQLKAEIAGFDSRIKLAVKETELMMRDKMTEAYETGQRRSMASLAEAKKLMSL
eukprot:5837750-Pleurochrysis_carterae.AAC.1